MELHSRGLVGCARSQPISREKQLLNDLAYTGFHNAAYCQMLEPWVRASSHSRKYSLKERGVHRQIHQFLWLRKLSDCDLSISTGAEYL
jgi:hypothetical protein